MILLETVMTPTWRVSFTKEEVLQLSKCSQSHYDFECQQLARTGGIIYGLLNSVEALDHPSCEISLRFRDVDILAKVLENSYIHGYSMDLFNSLVALLDSTRK